MALPPNWKMFEHHPDIALVYEQEDEHGNIRQYCKAFRTQEAKMEWIKGMRISAKYLGKHFSIIRLEA